MADTSTMEIKSVGEQIIEALDGRTQVWLVDSVKELGKQEGNEVWQGMTDVIMSRGINGRSEFSDEQLKGISKVLKRKIKKPLN